MTYREFLAQVSTLTDRLAEFSGSALGLVANNVLDSIKFTFAACEAGVEACLYPAHWDAPTAIENAEYYGHMPIGFTSDGELAVLSVSQPRSSAEVRSAEPSVTILTSGTTDKPKATRHYWRNIVRSATQGRSPDDSPDAVWLLAYNINQYAGLQVLVHAVTTGGTLVVPRGISPVDALDAMLDHMVDHVSATPTFWRMLLALISGDPRKTPDLRQITIGGEAVSDVLLRQLRERFPVAKVSHIYATSEIGSSVSVSDGKAGLPMAILERGANDLVQFRIVDGELQARSRIGMFGYHDSTTSTGDWVATGDLVVVRDGRIHFVGRVGSVINVGGVKVHPLPVEEVIGSVAGVDLVRVYGRPNPITGKIVAADVVAAQGHEPALVRRAISIACAVLPEAQRPLVVRMVDALPIVQNKMDRREL
ncbi:class I adenylate-forming enzyme family protein [Nocardia sp. NPDC060259]|uniref:class I adenylate-forming enzyme family protein n=1 Tax=Nocardia sp. NPDC060259 TaxID=3347088 RepID=UPI0036670077